MKRLPRPKCKWGYTTGQIAKIMGDRLDEFNKWMDGQTVIVCSGRIWDHDAKKHRMSGCGPHHVVTYETDVRQFLAGGPVLD